MEIRLIKTAKKIFLDLLLLTDEQESMIDKYLERGDMFALYDGDLKSVCVVTDNVQMQSMQIFDKGAIHGDRYSYPS